MDWMRLAWTMAIRSALTLVNRKSHIENLFTLIHLDSLQFGSKMARFADFPFARPARPRLAGTPRRPGTAMCQYWPDARAPVQVVNRKSHIVNLQPFHYFLKF
jgi:hypothetical protein